MSMSALCLVDPSKVNGSGLTSNGEWAKKCVMSTCSNLRFYSWSCNKECNMRLDISFNLNTREEKGIAAVKNFHGDYHKTWSGWIGTWHPVWFKGKIVGVMVNVCCYNEFFKFSKGRRLTCVMGRNKQIAADDDWVLI